MKFNFKKIVSVLTSTVMLSSTVALAAAANFPAPFVTGGNANVAIVYGSSPLAQDLAAVGDINQALTSSITASTSTATTTISGQNVVELDRPSSKLYLGGGTSDVFGRSITSSDMPTLLVDGVFTSNGDNKDHDYTQKIDVANMTYQLFDDSNYASDTPTLGIKIPDGQEILNYTITFTDKPDWGTSDDNLLNSELNVMGKNYLIVAQDNSTNTLTLLDSANTQIINEGDTKSVDIGGQTYDVTVTNIEQGSSANLNTVKLSVNGKTTSSLKIGSTYKVADGVYIGVKDVTYKNANYAGAPVSNAELAFGAGKLTLEDGASVELNDNSITNENGDDLIAHVTSSGNAISKIAMEWVASDTRFVTENSSLTMPGFGTVKVSTTGMTFPSTETTTVDNNGKYTAELKVTLKDGDYELNLLSNNQTDSNFTIIGGTDKAFVTSKNSSIYYDSDLDDNFVASWSSGKDSESYVFYADSFTTENSQDKATVRERNGNFNQQVAAGDDVILGDIDMRVDAINKTLHTIVLSAKSNGMSFHTLYTAAGLEVYLPYNGATGTGAINLTNGGAASFPLVFSEADKDGNLGLGSNMTFTVGLTSKSYAEVSNVAFSSGSEIKEIGSSDVYTGYAYSPLASQISWDNGPDQETADIVYHGAESYAKVYVTDVSGSVSSGGGQTGSLSVTDADASQLTGKNLIVVGGSCVNTVAASLLGSSTPLCGDGWQAATNVGEGSFLIKTFNSPYTSGKIATLVAGYNQVDTANAAKYLTTQTIDVSTVGTTYIGSTATQASLVTS